MDKLRRRKPAGDVDSVVVPAQQQIIAEKEVLHPAVRRNRVRKFGAENAPCLVLFDPRLDLVDADSLLRQQERRRQIEPQGVSVEISAVQRIPSSSSSHGRRRRPGIFAFCHD